MGGRSTLLLWLAGLSIGMPAALDVSALGRRSSPGSGSVVRGLLDATAEIDLGPRAGAVPLVSSGRAVPAAASAGNGGRGRLSQPGEPWNRS